VRLNILSPKANYFGYGRMATCTIAALKRAGVDIYDDLPSGSANARDDLIPPGARSAICAHASWMSTPAHCRGLWEGQTRSIWTMFETDFLPEAFREGLDQFDTVMVPSQQNLELFSRSLLEGREAGAVISVESDTGESRRELRELEQIPSGVSKSGRGVRTGRRR